MHKKQKADLDDGYVKIANALMQALYTLPISNREMRVLLFIIYQTYGYNHKERELSNSYIGQGVGITQAHAAETVKKLVRAKIVKQSLFGKRRTQTLSLNTHLNEWVTTPQIGSRTTPEMSTTEIGSRTTTEIGSRTTPEGGKQYNTDQYKTDKYKTECSGSKLPPHNFEVFLKLWHEWSYSKTGIDHVSRKARAEIESVGYPRMTDARLRYEDYFENLPTKNNQPLSARTWFTEAYRDYLPGVDENGIWYNINGQKCKGEKVYE